MNNQILHESFFRAHVRDLVSGIVSLIGFLLALFVFLMAFVAATEGVLAQEASDQHREIQIHPRALLPVNATVGPASPLIGSGGRTYSVRHDAGRQAARLPMLASGGGLPAFATGRPSQCPTVRWCGCWLQHYFGLTDNALWNARRWASIGRAAFHGCIGCVAVLTRGNGGGHVGLIRAYDERGNIVLLSGNHNGAVGVGVYPRSRVLAYRWVSA